MNPTHRMLLASTAVWRPLAAIKWTELFFVQAIVHGERGNDLALSWLMRQPHLLFCRMLWEGGKKVTVVCQPGLVTEKLRIRRRGEVFLDEFLSAGRARQAASVH